MHILENEKISLSLSDKGLITSLKNRATGHEYITYPEEDTWRLILYEGEVGKPLPLKWIGIAGAALGALILLKPKKKGLTKK